MSASATAFSTDEKSRKLPRNDGVRQRIRCRAVCIVGSVPLNVGTKLQRKSSAQFPMRAAHVVDFIKGKRPGPRSRVFFFECRSANMKTHVSSHSPVREEGAVCKAVGAVQREIMDRAVDHGPDLTDVTDGSVDRTVSGRYSRAHATTFELSICEEQMP